MTTAQVEELKTAGNAHFAAGQYADAIKEFSAAIDLQEGENQHVLYSNRSACHAQLKQYQDALSDANEAVKLSPEWAKGYGRQGAAFIGLN